MAYSPTNVSNKNRNLVEEQELTYSYIQLAPKAPPEEHPVVACDHRRRQIQNLAYLLAVDFLRLSAMRPGC